MQDVWTGGVYKGVSGWVKEKLEEDLKKIAPIWRVSLEIKDIIHLLHKEFLLTANYLKGHGKIFFKWFIEKHADEYLFQIKGTTNLRQDIIATGSLAISWNRGVYLEFLADRIRWYGDDKNTTIISLGGTYDFGSSCISKTFFNFVFVINCACVLICSKNTLYHRCII